LDEQRLRLPLSWGFIGRVRATVAEVLLCYSPDIRDAAVMVASELAENVIKYGEALDGDDGGYVSIVPGEDSITIKTVNGVSSPARAAAVMDRIAAIQASDDVGALYASRMQQMLLNPSDVESQVGLLRIAYEGNFRLSCSYEARVLVIAAERKLV
jgi:hypothetical protein